MKQKLFILILLMTVLAPAAHALEVKVFAPGASNFNDISYSGGAQSMQNRFTVKLIPSCFRARNKPVFNPISGTGTIGFQLGIAGTNYSVSFPAWVTKPLTGGGPLDTMIVDLTAPPRLYTAGTIASAYAARNLVLIRSMANPAITTVDALGNYAQADRTLAINFIRFNYDQVGGANCPLPPAPPPSWCTIQAQRRLEERQNWELEPAPAKEKIGYQVARFFSRPLSLLTAGFAMAAVVPPSGLPAIDPRWRQPDFDAPGWGNPAPYDPRYTAQDGPIGVMVKIYYSSDLRQLEIHAAFPSYDTNCGSYF
ncbi:MAG: hypothetical protein AB7N80_08665 [Bdellovibrionales bacterium]